MQKAIDGARAAGIELSKDVLSGYVNKYLEREKIYSAVDASRIIGMPLTKEKIAIIGKECLRKGKITSALEAYKIANKTPPEDELVICGNMCFNIGQITPGLLAYKLANKTPAKEILRICGEACLLEKRTDDARKAFVAAQKVEEMNSSKTIQVREISLEELKNSKIDVSSKGQKVCSDCGNRTDI